MSKVLIAYKYIEPITCELKDVQLVLLRDFKHEKYFYAYRECKIPIELCSENNCEHSLSMHNATIEEDNYYHLLTLIRMFGDEETQVHCK